MPWLSFKSRQTLGLLGLGGLLVAAIPLAAPGQELVLGKPLRGSNAWILGIYGEGLGLSVAAYHGFLWFAFVSYLGVLVGAATLPRRLLWSTLILLVVAFALAPPLLSLDVFNYIDYARLGIDHGLNPYVHTPMDAPKDPAFAHAAWRNTPSVYGPLFTLATYFLAVLPISVAFWTLKAICAAAVLGLAALCSRLAPRRGVAPAFAIGLIGLHPLVLVYVLGGPHNDAILMAFVTGTIAALLVPKRETIAGAGIVVAIAIKASAAFVVPFAALGAGRRRRFIVTALVCGLGTAVLSVLAFGPHVLASFGLLAHDQEKATPRSVPSTLGELLGTDVGTVQTTLAVLYLIAVVSLIRWTWRGGDWLTAAGWAGIGLLVASAWLLPWYLIWVLPFAALSGNRALIVAMLGLTAFQLINRIPM